MKDRSRRPEGGEWEPIKISSKFESSAYVPKSPNTREKVLFLNFLEEVTLKGKFVPYLASFSSLIHSLELNCVVFGGEHPWCSSSS